MVLSWSWASTVSGKPVSRLATTNKRTNRITAETSEKAIVEQLQEFSHDGLSRARGEFIGLVANASTFCPEDCVSRLITAGESDKMPGSIYSSALLAR